MSKLTIITNNHARDIIYELTEAEKAEFDWIDFEVEDENYTFFRYRGQAYCLSEFMRIEKYHPNPEFAEWHGYMSDTFFSGIVIKFTADYDQIIVGHYYS